MCLQSFSLHAEIIDPRPSAKTRGKKTVAGMTEEILVNVTPRETRVAVVENGMLQELHIERGWRRGSRAV